MIKLEKSGLPLYLDEVVNILAISAQLPFMGYSRKVAGRMEGLWAGYVTDEDEPVYDVYRGFAFEKDKALLDKYNFRYDITIVLPGDVDGELKKTSGHYHGYDPEHANTYAEVYEVIKGTALYVLQRADNFDTDPGNIKVTDVILATVHEGETIIVPPNYGHCSINVGQGPLVFSNLAYGQCPIVYDAVRNYRGMCYYVMKNNDGIMYQKNNLYKTLPEAKYADVRENPHLGIKFGLPVYHSFMENPDAFGFLGRPGQDLNAVMDMLIIR